MTADRDLTECSERADEPALDALLARHLPGLLTHVRLHCGPMVLARESVSDVTQSVCREILETASGFEYRSEAQFRKWLFGTATNMIKERQRRHLTQKRDVRREVRTGPSDAGTPLFELLPSFTTPSRVAIREEEMQQLERAFSQLSEHQRHVITSAKIIGLSSREIGEDMGRSEGAVRVLLHRALLRLASLIDEGTEG